MKKNQDTKRAGFTLIELLVVISIIGVLSSIILASLQKAKQSAENAVALAELDQIQNQLAIYFLDHGAYPNPSGSDNTWYCIGTASVCATSFDPTGTNTPVTPQTFALALPNVEDTTSLWSLFETKKAEASVEGFSQFYKSSSGHPVYYYCAARKSVFESNLCGVGYSWVFGPTFSGNTITYTAVEAGSTGSTIPGFSS